MKSPYASSGDDSKQFRPGYWTGEKSCLRRVGERQRLAPRGLLEFPTRLPESYSRRVLVAPGTSRADRSANGFRALVRVIAGGAAPLRASRVAPGIEGEGKPALVADWIGRTVYDS